MPNWVYNTLRVKGSKKRLTHFAWAIGSPSAVINWEQLAELVPMTWDHRDERSSGQLEIKGRDLVYRFDTAWNPRTSMIEDLAGLYPDLTFELHYLEECPEFAGAVVFDKGSKVGEAYLGDGEQFAFFDPYDEDEDDGAWDYNGMFASLLSRAKSGETIDWDERRRNAEQAQKASEEKAAGEAGEKLTQAVSLIKSDPKVRLNPKRINEILIPLASKTGPGLSVIPKTWWNDDLLVAFLLKQSQQAKLIPASMCTEALVDKLMSVKGLGYAGLYPIPYLKVGLRNERQALEYLKQASAGSLRNVPKSLRSAIVCEQAVRRDGKSLEHVPRALRTLELCHLAVENNGEALQFVPAQLKSAEMCKKAVTPENPNTLKFVPAKFLDETLVEKALNHTHSWRTLELGSVNSVALRRKCLLKIIADNGWRSIEEMTDQEHQKAWSDPSGQALLCKLLEDDSIGILKKVPVKFHTPEVLAAAAKHSALANFQFIPDEYKTSALCRQAIEADYSWGGESLCHVPPKLRDRNLCLLALEKAIVGYANIFRTEKFKNEFLIWLKQENNKEGGIKKSIRAHLSSCFVESVFPDGVWDRDLAQRSLASSPYAVLFIPRRYVNEESLIQVLQDYFPTYLLLEQDVAKEFAIPAVNILRKYVGDRAWQLSVQWKNLSGMLKDSKKDFIPEQLEQLAFRWLVTEFSVKILEQMINSMTPTQSAEYIKKIMNVNLQSEQIFPDLIDRVTLTVDELHLLLFACDKEVVD